MTDFNAKINAFMTAEGRAMTREEWMVKYPWSAAKN